MWDLQRSATGASVGMGRHAGAPPKILHCMPVAAGCDPSHIGQRILKASHDSPCRQDDLKRDVLDAHQSCPSASGQQGPRGCAAPANLATRKDISTTGDACARPVLDESTGNHVTVVHLPAGSQTQCILSGAQAAPIRAPQQAQRDCTWGGSLDSDPSS